MPGHHVTTGGVPNRPVMGWISQPSTRPVMTEPPTSAGVVGRSRPSGSSGGPGRPSLTPGSLLLEDQVVAAYDAGVVEPVEQLLDGAVVGQLGVRLEVVPRLQHEDALVGAGVGQAQRLLVAAAVAHHDQVDVEG